MSAEDKLKVTPGIVDEVEKKGYFDNLKNIIWKKE